MQINMKHKHKWNAHKKRHDAIYICTYYFVSLLKSSSLPTNAFQTRCHAKMPVFAMDVATNKKTSWINNYKRGLH